MKNPEVTETSHKCEFCNKTFARERTLLSHACQIKNRWLDKDKQGNRIGYQTFLQFYKKHTAAKKVKPYEDFIRSPYYTAFVKFGTYCAETNCVNVSHYVEWLLKENVKLDNWVKDSTYNKFLVQFLRMEDPMDALKRSIQTLMDLAEQDEIQYNDVLRYGNTNKICHNITSGKISPWILFQSDSGVRFLDTLTEDHVKLIIEYIDPEQWALKFHRSPDNVREVKSILKECGL
jgi:hypothetical protein